MQKKNKKIISIGIVIVVVILLLLLIIFFKDIVNTQDKNKLALYENTPTMLVSSNPNPPKLSAGMIPIKWNGENFVITTKDDSEWLNSQPAFIMLNDGYYKSELERGISDEQLMQNAVGVGVPDDPSIRGTIFMWLPRFVYNADGEIGYIKEETTPGEEWTVPDLFMYKTADETKPDFSLSGVWVEKDIDTAYLSKITQMNQEESIYGFIANTKAVQITTADTNAIQKYVGADASVRPQIDNPTNLNRIILKIINQNQYEPIKANIAHNTVDEKIEIRVTYTKNGISKIIDEYGNAMTLAEEDGVILTDTGANTLGKGTYKFTVIDNVGNKKELSITPNIDSLFKVAYINGTDNMDNIATYNKTQETKTNAENTLISQIQATDATKTYSRAIQDINGLTTAVSQRDRTSEEEQLYLWNTYTVNTKTTYTWKAEYAKSQEFHGNWQVYYYQTIKQSSDGSSYTLSNKYNEKGGNFTGSGYSTSTDFTTNPYKDSISTSTGYYYWYGFAHGSSQGYYYRYGTHYYRTEVTNYSKGNFYKYIADKEDAYVNNEKNNSYWYVRGNALPKYTICKYSSNLNLQSTYDVDTKTLITEPIDISSKGKNKVKLTLNTTGSNYKTYISSDNTNWQEVTEISSGTPKELNVDGWSNLYIKIETNTSTINDIDIAYYKD